MLKFINDQMIKYAEQNGVNRAAGQQYAVGAEDGCSGTWRRMNVSLIKTVCIMRIKESDNEMADSQCSGI
jgi:hypothetical protein